MDTADALALSEEAGLQLVEVNPKTSPPVCKILDYGKFKYENSKREAETKRNRHVQELKEVKFRPKTHVHDFDFKVKHIRRFLEDGDKVKLLVQFRGREITHPETGRAVLDRVCKETEDLATVIQFTQMEGNRMNMVLAPKVANRGGGARSKPAEPSTRADAPRVEVKQPAPPTPTDTATGPAAGAPPQTAK